MRLFILFLITILVTIVINRILLVFVKNLGTRGKEEIQVRWASTSKPSLGGLSFYFTFVMVMAFVGLLDIESAILSRNTLLGLFISLSLSFVIGFLDDTYNTNPILKALGQILCGIVLFYFNIRIEIFGDFYFLNLLITIFWVVGLMNSINMLDNMDGVCSSISLLIISTFFIIMSLTQGYNDTLTSMILLSVMGSLVGFLYHNWYPSKIYMGDAGSQFIGLFLAAFGIILVWNNPFNMDFSTYGMVIFPIAVFSVPIIDTFIVFIARVLNGTSPFVGGADHTTHHMVYFGFSEVGVIGVFALIYALLNGVILFVLWKNLPNWFSHSLLFLFFIACLLVIYRFYKVGSLKKEIIISGRKPNKIMRKSYYEKVLNMVRRGKL